MVTTQNMTAVRVSTRSAQESSKAPLSIHVTSSVVRALPPRATSAKTTIESRADITRPPLVTSCAPRSPMARPKKPAMKAPSSGRNTMRTSSTVSALHQVDVFDGDGAPVPEEHDQDRQTDCRLSGSYSPHEQGEDLPNEVVQMRRKGDQVDVDR